MAHNCITRKFIKGFSQEMKTVKIPLDQKRVLSFLKRLYINKLGRLT